MFEEIDLDEDEFDEDEFDEDEFDEDDYEDDDFASVDAFIEYLSTLSRPSVSIIDVERVKQMREAAGIINRTLRKSGCNARVTIDHDSSNPYIGGVSIEGADIVLQNSEGFIRAAGLADNVEVYPLNGNKIRMTFTFRRLTIALETKEN